MVDLSSDQRSELRRVAESALLTFGGRVTWTPKTALSLLDRIAELEAELAEAYNKGTDEAIRADIAERGQRRARAEVERLRGVIKAACVALNNIRQDAAAELREGSDGR